jgi:hypothetical protein
MTTNIELQKSKVQTIEQILERKNGQLTALKDGLKIAEALNYGIKNVSKKIDDIVSPKTPEIFQLLLDSKISPSIYKVISDILSSIESSLRSSGQDAEKILYTRQCEINFLQTDITQLKTELAGALSVLSDLEKEPETLVKEEKNHEYIRPDKNPNTRSGRAALDLAARKAAWKEKKETEGSTVIVSEELKPNESVSQEESLELKPKEKKGKKKLFNLF